MKKKKPVKKRSVASRPKPRPKAKPRRKKSSSKKKPLSKAKKAAPQGDQLGEVVAFFRIPVVAVIKVTQGNLKLGDRIWIKGHTTDLKQVISSMQVDHQPIQEARKGDEVGLKISSRARLGDRVYRI